MKACEMLALGILSRHLRITSQSESPPVTLRTIFGEGIGPFFATFISVWATGFSFECRYMQWSIKRPIP